MSDYSYLYCDVGKRQTYICGNCFKEFDSEIEVDKHMRTEHRDDLWYTRNDSYEVLGIDPMLIILDNPDNDSDSKLYVITYLTNIRKKVKEEDNKPDRDLVTDNLNLGQEKLVEHMLKLEKKGILLEDMVVGRNKKGKFTLHYYIDEEDK